jgi:hypothetical protein
MRSLRFRGFFVLVEAEPPHHPAVILNPRTGVQECSYKTKDGKGAAIAGEDEEEGDDLEGGDGSMLAQSYSVLSGGWVLSGC